MKEVDTDHSKAKGGDRIAILAECPVCHKKQKVANKRCACGENLDKWKQKRKVRFHIVYRINGKQQKKALASFMAMDPCSLGDAKKVEAKYVVSKTENRLDVFDIKKEDILIFKELSDWYTEKVLPVRAANKGLKGLRLKSECRFTGAGLIW